MTEADVHALLAALTRIAAALEAQSELARIGNAQSAQMIRYAASTDDRMRRIGESR